MSSNDIRAIVEKAFLASLFLTVATAHAFGDRIYSQKEGFDPGGEILLELEGFAHELCDVTGLSVTDDINFASRRSRLIVTLLRDEASDCSDFRPGDFLRKAFGPITLSAEFNSPENPVVRAEIVYQTVSGEVLQTTEWFAFSTSSRGRPEYPQSGTYFSPQLPGAAWVIERAGDRLFVLELDHDPATGQPRWRAGDVQLDSNLLTFQLLEVTGGPCLACGRPQTVAVTPAAEVVRLAFRGSSQLVLRYGEELGPAIELQPLLLKPAVSSEQEFESAFVMPDLSGTWIFIADRSVDGFPLVLERMVLERVELEETDSGIPTVRYRDSDQNLDLICYRILTPDYDCLSEWRDDEGQAWGAAFFGRDITHNKMADLHGRVIAVRLE
ncbi:MAG: hypothetical protein AAGA23_21200 [Pseudomonadota bacterium]